MEAVMAKVAAMLVAALLLLDLVPSAPAATTCADVATQIQPCLQNFNGVPTAPLVPCCNGLAAIKTFEQQIGIAPTCNCTKGFFLQIPGLTIDFQLSVDVQNNCSVSLGFSLATNTAC